jgi:hypothetical protein
MAISSAPSLLIGLSARIFIDRFILCQEPTMRDFGLLALWQGVAVYYAFTINQEFAITAAALMGSKIIFEFSSERDITRFAYTVLGAALGVVVTDILSRFLRDGLHNLNRAPRSSSLPPQKSHNRAKSNPAPEKKRKSVHEQCNDRAEPVREGSSRRNSRHQPNIPIRPPTQSDITSLDSTLDSIGRESSSLSPLEREIARLRARASLADTERRRYKEERKWAISQGNHARASQMTWEVKRYKTLMQSFCREADALVAQCESFNATLVTIRDLYFDLHDRHIQEGCPFPFFSFKNPPSGPELQYNFGGLMISVFDPPRDILQRFINVRQHQNGM